MQGLKGEIQLLQSSVKSLTDENKSLKDQNASLQSQVLAIGRDSEELEQYTRRNSVRITGIPEAAGESTDALVLDLSKEMKSDITTSDIDRSHRVGPVKDNQSRPIIVKFATYNARRRFFGSRKSLKENPGRRQVFVNEDLTRARNNLLYQARRLTKASKLAGAWSTDGNIFIKTHAGSRIRITNDRDLQPFSTGVM